MFTDTCNDGNVFACICSTNGRRMRKMLENILTKRGWNKHDIQKTCQNATHIFYVNSLSLEHPSETEWQGRWWKIDDQETSPVKPYNTEALDLEGYILN